MAMECFIEALMQTFHGNIAEALDPSIAEQLAEKLKDKTVILRHRLTYILLQCHGYKTQFITLAAGVYEKGLRMLYIPHAVDYMEKIFHLTIPYDVTPPTYLSDTAQNINVIKTVLFETKCSFKEYHDKMEYFTFEIRDHPTRDVQLKLVDSENHEIADLRGEAMLEIIPLAVRESNMSDEM
jgi:hypothetical protein